MSIILIQGSELRDLVHACVAGLKRDRRAMERCLRGGESRRAAIRRMVEGLDDPELELVGAADPEAAARLAGNVLKLAREMAVIRIRFVDRVLSGTRLNLPALYRAPVGSKVEGASGASPFAEMHRAVHTAHAGNGAGCITEDGPFGKTAVWFHKSGIVHRNISDGPALSTRWPDSRRQIEMYMMDGRLHRPSGPAVIEYDKKGEMILGAHFERGLLHRDPKHGPALRYALFRRGRKISERHEYWLDGQPHRMPADGPALLELDSGGRCIRGMYFVYGREGAPPEKSALTDASGPHGMAFCSHWTL